MVWLLVSVALTLAPLDAEAPSLWIESLLDVLLPEALLPDVLSSEVLPFGEPASALGALGALPVAELPGPPCAFPADPDAAAPPLAPFEAPFWPPGCCMPVCPLPATLESPPPTTPPNMPHTSESAQVSAISCLFVLGWVAVVLLPGRAPVAV